MDRKEYLDQRKELVDLEAAAYRDFDKALLTLSSGAIALSIAFLDKLPFTEFVYLLVSSWILWSISILLQLTSFYITPKAMREGLKILNEQYKKSSMTPKNNKYLGISSKLNLYSVVIFGLGVLLFMAFAFFNIGV